MSGNELVFPLGFLLFMTPLPSSAIAAVSLPLQRLAAGFTTMTLAAAGIPFVRDGLFIDLVRVRLEISEACNGLRFLLAMIVIGAAFAWLTQVTLARRLAVFALAVTVGLVANLIRVAGTALLAEYYGIAAATGFFHVAYGKVVYLVMLAPFIAGVVYLKRRAVATAR